MSQSQTVTLDDKEVSRRLAHKAMYDKFFERELLACASTDLLHWVGKGSDENYMSVSRAIIAIRTKMVDQARLRVPLLNGIPQDLTLYLKKMQNSRLLLGKASVQTVDGIEVTAVERDREWGWVGNSMCIARLAVAIHQSIRRFQADPTPFPFERLPPELRLQVYRESLIGASHEGINASAQFVTVTPARERNGSNFKYESLYRSTLNEVNVDLLVASRLLNNEAIPILYQLRTFNFKTDVGSAVRFLRSVPEQGRRNLHGIAMEYHDKQQQDYCCFPQKTFGGKGPGNKAAWSKACAYIAGNVNVKALSLTINVKVPADFKTLKWVQDVVKIKKLKSLVLKISQHERSGPCTVRTSCKGGTLLATDPCFSEHLVPLFEYLREKMLEQHVLMGA